VAGMSVSTGLISGMDTAGIIDQLMQVEANSQTLLKQRMSADQSKATAYRAINTRFDALRTAAEAVTKPEAWTAVKATSSSSTVTAAASATALAGSLTFSVDKVATTHSIISVGTWDSTTKSYGSALTVTTGGTTTALTMGGSGSLADAVKAINDSGLNLSATAVKVSPTEYRLQVSTTKTGADAAFSIGAADSSAVVTQGQNAQLTVGTGPGKYTMTSATNTFSGLLDGTTLTVTEPAASVTIKVVSDPQAVANKINSLIGAANGLLDAISSYTRADSSSATLKGDNTLRQLSGQVLQTVSRTLGAGGSASVAGLQLAKDGKSFVFDSPTFVAKLTADPTVAKNMFTATSSAPGVDQLSGTDDDVVTPIGIAARLAALATTASDSTSGTLTLLAKSKDSAAKDLQERVDAWDIRLELRRTALTRQFTAMETALSTLQNQSSWLSSQISSLPSWSSSKS
jgi:flagellar hook-associated protein 2